MINNALNISSSTDPAARIKALLAGGRREYHPQMLVSALEAMALYFWASEFSPDVKIRSIANVRPTTLHRMKN